MARPTDYDPSYCERIVETGKGGASVVEMAFDLGVHRDTLSNWAASHPEFFEAFTQAKTASQVWWERKGRDNLATQGFQSNMWSRSMAARFPDDWRETKGIEHSGSVETIAKDQRDAAVAAALRADS